MANFIKLLSKKIIKPSNLTPFHHKTYKLSLMDRLNPHWHVPFVFFYPVENGRSNPGAATVSKTLKTSLSEVLTMYYPFAGRLNKDMSSIDCNDEGIELFEAQISFKMSEVLKDQRTKMMNSLFPPGILSLKNDYSSLVVIQLSFFECGGFALSTCMSHKVADGCSLISFLSDWSVIARHSGEIKSPLFISTSLLGQPDHEQLIDHGMQYTGNCVSKGFLFSKLRIEKLKDSLKESSGMQNPSRSRVVTALLYQRVVAATMTKVEFASPSMMRLIVNMRTRVSPQLPKNSIGNFCWSVIISTKDEKEMELQYLVESMRNALRQITDENGEKIAPEHWISSLRALVKLASTSTHSSIPDFYTCTDLSSFSFYKLDFGWGKPVFVRPGNNYSDKFILLMDTREGDGIVAWVTLEEKNMDILQQDEELVVHSPSLN